MNVLYRCPECGMKLFALPGGTAIKCATHTNQVFLQVEDYNGPDFLDKSRTGHIVTPGADPKNIPKRSTRFDPVEDSVDIDVLRTIYLDESGEKADGRWSLPRVRHEIQNIRQFKADKAAQEYRAKREKIARERAAQAKLDAEAKAEQEREKLADLDAYIKQQINAALANKEELKHG